MENAYRRKKDPIQNRQIILDTALEILSTLDWSQVTFQSISEKTGLSKGGIIHHFKNKDELLDELMKQNLSKLTDFVHEYHVLKGIRTTAKAYLKFVLENGENVIYQKIMRVVLQLIIVKSKYRNWWEDWLKKYILPDVKKAEDIQNLIFFLAAEGIWYNDSVGFSYLNNTFRKILLDFLDESGMQ